MKLDETFRLYMSSTLKQPQLGDGFKHVLCSSLFGEMIQID